MNENFLRTQLGELWWHKEFIINKSQRKKKDGKY